jgi:hypothetical protein
MSPTKKPPPAKKRPAKKAAADDVAPGPREAELGGRLRAIVQTAIGAMEARVAKHIEEAQGKPLTDDVLTEVMAIGEKAAVWMGHVRRSDEAARAASKKISRAAAIEWGRALTEDEREAFVTEISGEEPSRSVFE